LGIVPCEFTKLFGIIQIIAYLCSLMDKETYKKRERPNLLRPFFRWQIGSRIYNSIRNRQMLAAPWRQNVRISRRLFPEHTFFYRLF
jgi:hypothetical protein